MIWTILVLFAVGYVLFPSIRKRTRSFLDELDKDIDQK